MEKNYETEVKERWGDLEAFGEFKTKTKYYKEDKWGEISDGFMGIFALFSRCKKKGYSPDSEQALKLVNKLQSFITDNCYTCTDEILFGIGQMYASDVRYKENIDKMGEGTAEFVSKAISVKVKQKCLE